MELIKMSEEDFQSYAAEANGRSTMNVNDGCKNVHRRILFGLYRQKAVYNKPHKTSLSIVGAVSPFHPHGDASIYDAAMRLSQSHKMRYPLVDVHGNNGNILSERYAASRYTHMRLTPIGESMLKDLNKNASPMVDVDGADSQEPSYLPSVFPNALCNGGLGIGIGMSCALPPHNLVEICNAIEGVIDNRNITLAEVMQLVPAPDFPTGGTIVNPSALVEAYRTGKGSIKLRSKYHMETIDGMQHIVVTEFPYLVSYEKNIIGGIQKMVEDGYTDIYDIEDHSGKNGKGRFGVELHIILEKKANTSKVLKDLFEKTSLENTIKINNTVQKDGGFATLNLLSMLRSYINLQHEIIINVTNYDLAKIKARLHIVEGLILALVDIDEVVNIIKNSKDKASARAGLISAFKLDTLQADAILDIRLSKLTSLEIDVLKKELADGRIVVNEYLSIIGDKSIRETIIKKNLQTLRELSDSRRTVIQKEVSKEDRARDDFDIVVIAQNNEVKSLTLDKIPFANKGTKGKPINADFIYSTTYNKQSLVLSDNKIYKIFNSDIVPVDDVNAVGQSIADTNVIQSIIEYDDSKKYIVFVMKSGKVKKTLVSEYANFDKTTIALRVKDDDSVIFMALVDDLDSLCLMKSEGKILKYDTETIKVSGRVTYGNKGSTTDVINAAVVYPSEELVTYTDSCSKTTKIDDIKECSKDSLGHTASEGCIGLTRSTDYLLVIGDNGKGLFVKNENSSKSLKSIGAKLFGGTIVKVLNF